jgi:phosphoribosylanthranilate isomerase
MVQPYAVDVISGVEKQAGVKDGKLMQCFVCAAKGFNHSDKDKI